MLNFVFGNASGATNYLLIINICSERPCSCKRISNWLFKQCTSLLMKFFLYLIRTLLNAMGFFVQPGKLYIFLFFDKDPANAMGFFEYTLICSLRVRKTPCVLRFLKLPFCLHGSYFCVYLSYPRGPCYCNGIFLSYLLVWWGPCLMPWDFCSAFLFWKLYIYLFFRRGPC